MTRQITDAEWEALTRKVAELDQRTRGMIRLGPKQEAPKIDSALIERMVKQERSFPPHAPTPVSEAMPEEMRKDRLPKSITDDPNDPRIKRGAADTTPVPQSEVYLVLPEAERAKGFVRPYRDRYKHVGVKPKYPLRSLTPEEKDRYGELGCVAYEQYPESESPVTGRFWTKTQFESGCDTITTMGRELSETYARNPMFYGATYCVGCKMHRPVEEFVWTADGERVGS